LSSTTPLRPFSSSSVSWPTQVLNGRRPSTFFLFFFLLRLVPGLLPFPARIRGCWVGFCLFFRVIPPRKQHAIFSVGSWCENFSLALLPLAPFPEGSPVSFHLINISDTISGFGLLRCAFLWPLSAAFFLYLVPPKSHSSSFPLGPCVPGIMCFSNASLAAFDLTGSTTLVDVLFIVFVSCGLCF